MTRPPEGELGALEPWKCRSASPKEGKNRGKKDLLVSAVAFSSAGTSIMTLQFGFIFETILCSL